MLELQETAVSGTRDWLLISLPLVLSTKIPVKLAVFCQANKALGSEL